MNHDDHAIPDYLVDVALMVRQWIEAQPYDRVEIANPYHDRGAICASFALGATIYSIEAVPGEVRLRTNRGRYGHGGDFAQAYYSLGYNKPYNPWGRRPSTDDIAHAKANYEHGRTS